jgi:methionyl-tRNA synthetase
MAGPVPPTPPSGPAPAAAAPAEIGIEDFKKVSLRVGRVLEAAEHPNAQKLLVLKVDLGGGDVRQIVSGIKPWYAPADLVGKAVIVVANLRPATLRGVESRGMILAATSGAEVVVCTTLKDAAPGSPVS